MAEAYIRDKVLRKDEIHADPLSAWRRFGMHLYQGYAGTDFFKIDYLPEELSFYHDFFTIPEYNHDGRQLRRRRKKKTINMTYMTCALLRILSLNEGFDLKVEGDEEEGKKKRFFEDVLANNNFLSQEGELLEYACAMGDSLKTVWFDPEENVAERKPKINFVKGHRFMITEHHNGIVKGVVISTTKRVKKGKKTVYHTLLEYHRIDKDIYTIYREIYESKHRNHLKDRLGYRQWCHEFGMKESQERETFDVEEPMFVFQRMPWANNKDSDAIRGIGLTLNALDTQDAINNAFDADDRESVDGAMKMVVPSEWIDTEIDEDGKSIRRYNDRTRFVLGLNIDENHMSKPEVFAPTLRTEQYEQKIRGGMKRFATQCNLHPGTFDYDHQTQATATQVKLEHKTTHDLRQQVVAELKSKWEKMLWIIYAYAKHLKIIPWEMEREDLEITFPDGVITDDKEEFERDMKALQTQVVSKDYMRQRWFNLNDDESRAMAEQIDEEQEAGALDIEGMMGGEGT